MINPQDNNNIPIELQLVQIIHIYSKVRFLFDFPLTIFLTFRYLCSCRFHFFLSIFFFFNQVTWRGKDFIEGMRSIREGHINQVVHSIHNNLTFEGTNAKFSYISSQKKRGKWKGTKCLSILACDIPNYIYFSDMDFMWSLKVLVFWLNKMIIVLLLLFWLNLP